MEVWFDMVLELVAYHYSAHVKDWFQRHGRNTKRYDCLGVRMNYTLNAFVLFVYLAVDVAFKVASRRIFLDRSRVFDLVLYQIF